VTAAYAAAATTMVSNAAIDQSREWIAPNSPQALHAATTAAIRRVIGPKVGIIPPRLGLPHSPFTPTGEAPPRYPRPTRLVSRRRPAAGRRGRPPADCPL